MVALSQELTLGQLGDGSLRRLFAALGAAMGSGPPLPDAVLPPRVSTFGVLRRPRLLDKSRSGWLVLMGRKLASVLEMMLGGKPPCVESEGVEEAIGNIASAGGTHVNNPRSRLAGIVISTSSLVSKNGISGQLIEM